MVIIFSRTIWNRSIQEWRNIHSRWVLVWDMTINHGDGRWTWCQPDLKKEKKTGQGWKKVFGRGRGRDLYQRCDARLKRDRKERSVLGEKKTVTEIAWPAQLKAKIFLIMEGQTKKKKTGSLICLHKNCPLPQPQPHRHLMTHTSHCCNYSQILIHHSHMLGLP